MDAEREWVQQWWGQIMTGEQEERQEEEKTDRHPLHVWSPTTFQPGCSYGSVVISKNINSNVHKS